MGLDLDQLRTLIAFSETGSVMGAARVVHKTPSAVSTHLSKLAATIGRPIVQKKGREIELTADGTEVVRYARRMIGLEHEVLGRFNPSSFAGTLRVGLPDDYVPALMSPLFEALRAVAPQARLEVHCAPSSELRPKLRDAGLDLAILSAPGGAGEDSLLRHERVVWASARHTDAMGQNPIPLAVFPEGCIIRSAALNGLEAGGLEYDIVCESRSMSAVQAAIQAGLAIAPVAESCVPDGAEAVDPSVGLPQLDPIDIVLAMSAAVDRSLVTRLLERLRERVN